MTRSHAYTDAPNVEEQLSAAAFTILTDDNRHEPRARFWAERFLAKGTQTAFQRSLERRARLARGRAFAGRVA